MTSAGEQASHELKKLIGEFEHMLDAALREIKSETRAVDRYVHDNAWVAVGIAAAAGFVFGCLVGRRD
jgi:ElaB/YqjD/DUF883 family membrane-anchored ribosome-binding protein